MRLSKVLDDEAFFGRVGVLRGCFLLELKKAFVGRAAGASHVLAFDLGDEPVHYYYR